MASEHAPPAVEDAVLDDLRARLRATRRPVLGPGGWELGAEPDYLAELVAYWADEYDWRKHEARIRALPWRATEATPCLYQPASEPDAPVVVLLHGWPDSILRFERVLPLLADLTVVVPAFPGYPYGAPRAEGQPELADTVAAVLAELGHERPVVSGGDVGAGVAVALGARGGASALHMTDVPMGLVRSADPADLDDDALAFLKAGRRWSQAEGAYMHQHATRPFTLAPGLNDSPAGLAAWILEKLRVWSDCGGNVESVWTRDELLTWITAYWMTGSIGTSFGPYYGRREPITHVDVPTAVQIFPHDIGRPARSVGERAFDLRSWEELDAGGHFAAWERPDVFVAGLRRAVALA